ncbi:hypothetical protein TNCV_2370441 [Trichonephila clavipes]|nr:hypothetical protein TNCV_2370441 [Trichonephila clavipes]
METKQMGFLADGIHRNNSPRSLLELLDLNRRKIRDYERLMTENNSHIDSDSESEISLNDSGSNESLLTNFSRGVDRMDQHLTYYSITKERATRGLLATDHVILNHGQVTWTTPELAPPSPNYHTTPTGGRFSSRQI